jgi:chorismate mutase
MQINKPFIVSGPCSAESEEQMLQTAMALAHTQRVDVLRAGIWKPRTRPNSFEGYGEKALPWLINAGKQSGLPVATEVANARHVELCLKYGVNAVWIGARTTVNPFYVQEIAYALKGSNIPVWVKNPVNPDIDLWVGAVERLLSQGINEVMVIHRGFSVYEKNNYRNSPVWHIPIEFKRRMPHIPMLCDPSHICGNRHLLHQVAQKAMDLDMAGLMIESHIEPNQALSDAQQQITPDDLNKLLCELVYRSHTTNNVLFLNKLDELRLNIDEIDEQLIKLLAERMKLVELIGEYKAENNVTVLQIKRWEYIIKSRTSWANKLGLNVNFINEYLKIIHKESISKQLEVMHNLLNNKV